MTEDFRTSGQPKPVQEKPPKLSPQLESEWLGVTLHSIGDGVIATDQNAVVTFINPVAESLTGWTVNEAVGLPLDSLFKIIHEETRAAVETPIAEALREGRIAKLTNHILLVARNGTERPISDSAAPIFDRNRNIVGAVLVFRDMTEQRQHERDVQNALDYAAKIIDTLRHPFLVLDKDLRVISANRSFYRTYHTSLEKTEGQRLYDLGSGQWNVTSLRNLLEEVLPEKTCFEDFEVDSELPSLGRRIMLLNGRCIEREDKPNLILLGIEDITEQRQAKEKQREIEDRFTTLVKNIKDHAIFTVDTRGYILSWNMEAERILGFLEGEAIGQHFSIIFTPEDIEHELPEQELRVATEQGRAEDERWHQRKNGERFWALGIVTPMHDGDGKHIGFSKILRDITDRQQAKEALQRADRRKDEFLAMLSHELRNPLAPLLHAVRLMETQKDQDEEQRTVTGIIERQVHHLKRLVDDLLEVSRIRTGKIRLQTARVNLEEIVERAIERTYLLLEEKQQQLSCSFPPETVWLEADSVRLEQVFGNLLKNASKYNDVGAQVWITVEAEANHVVARVRDNGFGIAPDLLPNIFELFTQSDQSRENTEGGLGIGLALVKMLVEMHAGTIEVHSEGSGRGSEFVVRLPTAGLTQPEPAVPSAFPEATRTGLRILIVDDRVDAAKMLGTLLRSWKHEVQIAHTGQDALQAAAAFAPHAVFLDIGLPDMDGYEVAQRVRQDSRFNGVRLFAMTGYGQEEDQKRSREAGFDKHLIKPVDASELEELLVDIQPPASGIQDHDRECFDE